MAEADARAAVVARDIRTDARAAGPALVFSLRLNPSDYIQLKMCADRVGIGPSVLARNLIRVGLGQP